MKQNSLFSALSISRTITGVYLVATFFIGSSAFAHGTSPLNCQGHFDTKGELAIIMAEEGVRVSGTYMDKSERLVKFECVSKPGVAKKDKVYFRTTKNERCPVDYVRVPNTFGEADLTVIALVNTTSGDTHDWSGYDYQYFHCSH